MTSAYPAPLDVLIPQAQQLASEMGQIPSRNKLMTQFRIGAKKATQILDALTETGSDPATGPARRLHAVQDSADAAWLVSQSAPADPAPVEPDQAGPDTADVPALAGQATDAVNPPVPAPVDTREPLRRGWGWTRRIPPSWPLILLALPAFVAIWSGWVGLGELTGFGLVHPLPGIADGFTLNTAITLPIGVETYAAYALRVALSSGSAPKHARLFAGWSAVASLVLGAAGQVAYHLMTIHRVTAAPWPITTAVACLPVVVLGCGAALAHLQHRTGQEVSE